MIDTDKYEGHTPAPWTVDVHKVGEDTSAIVIESAMTTHSNEVLAEVEIENGYALIDAQLIADAPLLLAEVKRLQSIIDVFDEYMMNDFMTDFSRSEAHAIWNELVRGDGI
jgi:hypothetical protein